MGRLIEDPFCLDFFAHFLSFPGSPDPCPVERGKVGSEEDNIAHTQLPTPQLAMETGE
jgi:hypothetical protein